MPRRNLIPLALLAVLAVGAAVFAVVGAAAAPNATTITVQNASAKTYGSPTGSTSFLMDLVTTLSSGPKAGTLSQTRLLDYLPPNRLVVYPVGTKSNAPSIVPASAIACNLSVFTAMVAGPTAWNVQRDTYTRTESVADYTARVPRTGGTTCEPQVVTARGSVDETVVIRSGYLVAARERIVVPPQTLGSGQTASHGVEGQTIVFIRIGGVQVRKLSP
ncbi:MAG TPA: hypothetical protein VG346_13315 [Acidimicrobiales bacterium]|nr:hypothetical protein [Acidimicrobiales bacterium]